MKKLKTLMATLLALTLVLGFSMTSFAAEENVTEMGTKNIDINVGYSRTQAAEDGKDDTEKDIYDIKIEYDALDFSYEADNIKWNPDKNDYEVTLKADTNTPKGIKVTNQSNKAVKMTPSLDNSDIAKQEGVSCAISLLRGSTPLWGITNMDPAREVTDSYDIPITLDAGGGTDALEVKVTNVDFTSDIQNFNSKFAAVSLSFTDAMDIDEGEFEDPF